MAVLGDPGVGKTSIIQRFLYPERVLDPQTSTIHPGDFFEHLLYKDKSVHLHIVDTPGEKKLALHHASSVVPMIYRGVNGAAVVFDVGDSDSFGNAIDWVDAIHVSIRDGLLEKLYS